MKVLFTIGYLLIGVALGLWFYPDGRIKWFVAFSGVICGIWLWLCFLAWKSKKNLIPLLLPFLFLATLCLGPGRAYHSSKLAVDYITVLQQYKDVVYRWGG